MPPYPFAAVVGLDDLRLALVLNAVSPGVGGVLVRGEKGTAKSTIVRALASVLPPIPVVAGCRFACAPDAPDDQCPDGPHDPHGTGAGEPRGEWRPARLVELPVGAAEDRLVGSLDLERVLAEGVTAYEPGLLAAAHRGLLYVDEVNLLPDHLVDLLLDAAAMGVAHVEREGVSVRHAARFLLVGHHEPGGGRAAAAAARPVRPHRGGAGLARARRARRGGAAAAGLRGRPRGLRRALARRRQGDRRAHRRRAGAAARSGAAGRRAAADHADLRGLRGRRDARRPGDGPRRDRAGGLARPDRRRGRGRAPGGGRWRCRTGAGGTRSTRPGWTRGSSTRRWRTPSRIPSRTARARAGRSDRQACGPGRFATPTAAGRRRPGRTAPSRTVRRPDATPARQPERADSGPGRADTRPARQRRTAGRCRDRRCPAEKPGARPEGRGPAPNRSRPGC